MVLRMYIITSQLRRLTTLLKAGQNSGGGGGGNAKMGQDQKRKTGTFLFGLPYMLNGKCEVHLYYVENRGK